MGCARWKVVPRTQSVKREKNKVYNHNPRSIWQRGGGRGNHSNRNNNDRGGRGSDSDRDGGCGESSGCGGHDGRG
jgi:hypothetical protein